MAAIPTGTDPRAVALAAEAERLSRQGQAQASTRLWDQVLALAPGHAGALNHFGAQALAKGELATASDWLQRATRGAPPLAMAHANLARVLRLQGQREAALAELDRALRLEPSAYAVHFEKAAIYGEQDRGKDQALAYGSALQLMPAGAASSPDLQALVQRAQQAVMANQSELGDFLSARLRELRGGETGRALARFDESLEVSLGRKPLQLSRPAMYTVPGLPAIAFFERED
ncbi:MAG: hypothetical protein KA196_02840, partial [Arenimonas sp.]|nr:hypothetical protein [Arenimonas sp.]